MGFSIMDWFRAHILPKRDAELPDSLRDASHKLSNESMMIHGEVVMAAGSLVEYYRRARQLRETMDEVLRRAKNDGH